MRLAIFAALAAMFVAAPAAAQDERVWRFNDGPDRAALVYGMPETDDIGSILACAPGRRIQVSTFVDHEITRPETTTLVLTSGKVSARLTARATFDEMNGDAFVEATFAGGGPVMQEFARTGAIRITVYGVSTDMPAAPLRDVGRLLRACAR